MRLELFTNYGTASRDAIRLKCDGGISIPLILLKHFHVKANTACRIYTCDKTKNVAIEFNVKKGTEHSRNLCFYDYGAVLNTKAALKFLNVKFPVKKSIVVDVQNHDGKMLFNVSNLILDLKIAA